MDIIVKAVPFFFLAIFAEYTFSKIKKTPVYRFSDSIGDLGCGVMDQILSLLTHAFFFWLYVELHTRFALFDISPSLWTWVLGFIYLDFLYYWFHRASHRINFIWATHIVHHQSEEYNLTVALRQGGLQALFSQPFYLTMAVIGFPLEMMVVCFSLNLIYQFWFHTRLIHKMGPMEVIMNTPSHHRVHHGINPEYIDKNYAGVFIIWDKIFGTFTPEGIEPSYGITQGLGSFNPLYAHLHYWRDLVGISKRTKMWKDKFLIWFKPPEWKPQDLGGVKFAPPVSKSRVKYDFEISNSMKLYIAFNFMIVSVMTTFLLVKNFEIRNSLFGISFVLGSLGILGGLLDGKLWAKAAERIRLMALVAVVYFYWNLSHFQ